MTDALGNTTQFDYNSGDGTLNFSLDAQERKTQYTYGTTPRQPSDVKVIDTDGSTVLRWQKYTYDDRGRVLVEKTVDPADGVTELQKVTRTYFADTPNTVGAGLLESVTRVDIHQPANNETTWYTYDSTGRVVKTHQTSLLGTCSYSYTVYDPAGHVLATVCSQVNYTLPTTVAEARALYDPNDSIKKNNRVTTHTYDTLGRRVTTTVNDGPENAHPFAQTTLTFYDALNRVTRTIDNYVNPNLLYGVPGWWQWLDGAWKDENGTLTISHGECHDQNIIADTAYNARGQTRWRRDVLGNMTLYGYDAAGRLVKTVQNASDPDYNNDYSGTGADPSLNNYPENQAVADQDLINRQQYDGNGNLVLTIDMAGRKNFTIYDALNRPVKTVRNAKEDATISLDPGDTGYTAANDPRAEDYLPDTASDRDQIELTAYDNMGRVRRRRDTLGQWTLYGYDNLDRAVRTIRYASNPDYDFETDTDLSGYFVVGAADQDLVTQTVYDSTGRVLYTIDELGSQTWHGYDGLGRQTRQIVHYVVQGDDPAGWFWCDTHHQWEYGNHVAVDHGQNDQNIVTDTLYDANGRVQWARDVEGKRVWHVFDNLGRQVKTITNYLEQGQSDPLDWVWDETDGRWEDGAGTPVDQGDNNDLNLIIETIYDVLGRVQKTRDTRGNLTLYGYNSAGQRIKTVQNASRTAFDVDNDPDLSGYTPAPGAGSDQDRVTTTQLGIGGRVVQATDAAGNVTWSGYDALGRRVRTINNYHPQGSPAVDPLDWVWSETRQRWERGISDDTSIQHGALTGENDWNIISDTVYNQAGQVVSTRDARGTVTAFTYDHTGRRSTTIQAYGTPLATTSRTQYDKVGRVLNTTANWVSSAELEPLPELRDQNLMTTYDLDRAGRQTRIMDPLGNLTVSAYHKDGRVKWTSVPERSMTWYGYDGLRRLVRTVQGYQAFQPSAWQRISFSSKRSGDPGLGLEIYAMNADGSSPVNLTNHAADDHSPAWSPDGSQIVFTSPRAETGKYEIYLMDADGSNVRRLTTFTETGQAAQWAKWSPDGTQIVFAAQSSEETRYKLYTINRDGSNLRLLFEHTPLEGDPLDATYPDWSPDGQKIAFGLGQVDTVSQDICVINVDGSQLVNLTNDSASHHYVPAWSPDGMLIAFQSKQDGNTEIYLMNADGSHPVNLTQQSASDHCPSWSPDGQRIVFYRCLGEEDREVYVMNADGSEPTALTGNLDEDLYPHWSPQVVDPAAWVWANNRWEDGSGHPVPHGDHHDRNVIVTTVYDLAGRRTQMVDPRGYATTYEYDQLGRRTRLTNPLNQDWETAYRHVEGGSRIELTHPNGVTHQVQRDFDRLGRPKAISYLNESPKLTPDVAFTYDAAGNRAAMTENDGVADVRVTGYAYDDLRRLTQVDFDTDGDSNVDETVRYAYDLAGHRTQLTLPGDLSVSYVYDVKGRLISLTDWDGHITTLTHDPANRLVAAERTNGLLSRYTYDAAGRLRLLRHTHGTRTLAHFAYEVDGRGNRTQAFEMLAHPSTGGMVYAYNNRYITSTGTWTDSAPYKVTNNFSAALELLFFGNTATLTVGTGPDHGLFDVYVNHSFWQSFDGYAATSGERTIDIPLASMGPHLLEIRHRHEKNLASTGHTLRFKQLVTPNTAYIQYTYDALSRLQEARYNPASNLSAPDEDLLCRYQYAYDLAGNRLSESVALNGGTPTVTNTTYNAANQISNQGFAYDNNGNLTSDGVQSYAWDRANRLLSMGGISYMYDGLGNRISQTANQIATQYLLDVQPGLVKVLAQTVQGSTTRFVYGPRGILAHENNDGDWSWMVRDGLGSVRGEVSDSVAMNGVQSFAPYGTAFGSQGTFVTPYAFTGEMMDDNGLLYLRARHYSPALGIFPSLDPAENGNRYQYVNANPINRIDPGGMLSETPQEGDNCYQNDEFCVEAPTHGTCHDGCQSLVGADEVDRPSKVQDCYYKCTHVYRRCLPKQYQVCCCSYQDTYELHLKFGDTPDLLAFVFRCSSQTWEFVAGDLIGICPEKRFLSEGDFVFTPEFGGSVTRGIYNPDNLREVAAIPTEQMERVSFLRYQDPDPDDEDEICPNADLWTAVSIALGTLGVLGVNLDTLRGCILGLGSPFEQMILALLGLGSGEHILEDLGLAIVDCGANVAGGGRIVGALEITNAIRTACFR